MSKIQMNSTSETPEDGQRILAVDCAGKVAIIGNYSAETDSVVSVEAWTTWEPSNIGGWLPLDRLEIPVPF